jgi:hypothetical protein
MAIHTNDSSTGRNVVKGALLVVLGVVVLCGLAGTCLLAASFFLQ